MDDLGSDHLPVLMQLSKPPAITNPKVPHRTTDWRRYTDYLQENPMSTFPLRSTEDIDRLAIDITQRLQSALNHATSNNTTARVRREPLPSAVKRTLEEKRRLRRLWHETRCPTIKRRLNATVERAKIELSQHAAVSWERHIQSVDEGGWISVHRLCHRLAGVPEPVRPLLAEDGTPRCRAADRANIFAECLERQFRPNPIADPDHFAAVEQHLRDYLATPVANEEDPVVFSPGLVRRVILACHPRKAPGADGIPNMALRHLPPRDLAALTRLFNGAVRLGHFPAVWKTGRVIMLPKPGKNPRLPTSYRPITLLAAISKVFEKLLLRHLTPHLTPRPEQHGFRAEHSTTLQVSRVLHSLTVAANKKETTVAVFLDMEKAFDRVWHSGLLYKIATTTTPRRIVHVLASFLSNRRFFVSVEGENSDEHPIEAGVPQGSCLSPICYARYTDDIPAEGGAQLALYADDAAYFASSIKKNHAASKMQRALDALPEWLGKWRLSVNVAKTQALLVSNAKRHPPNLTMQGQELEWSRTAKYLGVTIDRRLTMCNHVRGVVANVRATRALLRPVLSSRLPLRTKLGIYKSYVRSRLTYAAPAWFALVCESGKDNLRRQQSATLRTIVGAPRYVRNATIARDLKIESLDEYVSRTATNMFARADASRFPHLRDLAPQHARPPEGRPYAREMVAKKTTTTTIASTTTTTTRTPPQQRLPTDRATKTT